MSSITMTEQMLKLEFDRQVTGLLQRGYAAAAGLTMEGFLKHMEPLAARLAEVNVNQPVTGGERVPFVVVVKREVVAVAQAVSLAGNNGREAFTSMDAAEVETFKPIAGVELPYGMAYLLADVDTGAATLNVTPDAALPGILAAGRSPLTVEEGIALLTHFPHMLKKNACYYMLGSRCGDRRVTALWLSGGRPRLGWCWAGNVHTWLGSASCARRLGARAIT